MAQKTKSISPFVALERGVRAYDSQIARAISASLNAPIVAIYAFAAVDLFFAGKSFATWGISFLFGAIVPLVGIVVLLKTRRVGDFYVSNRSERLLPFVVTEVSYLAGSFLLLLAHSPAAVTVLMLAYVVNTGVYMVITLFWKISLHAAGLAGPLTVFFFIFGPQILPIFALIVPLAWSRLRLGAHTPFQVAIGAALSITLTYALLAFFPSSLFTSLFHFQ